MELLYSADAWIALDIILEIVLGYVDNIIFISIATGKLPLKRRKKATKIGMFFWLCLCRLRCFRDFLPGAMRNLGLLNFSWLSMKFRDKV
jgi:hypothetical protein